MGKTINVVVPLPLRRFTGGRKRVQVAGADDLPGLIRALEAAYPGIEARLLNGETGEPFPYVQYYVNGQIKGLHDGPVLEDGDEVTVALIVTGG